MLSSAGWKNDLISSLHVETERKFPRHRGDAETYAHGEHGVAALEAQLCIVPVVQVVVDADRPAG